MAPPEAVTQITSAATNAGRVPAGLAPAAYEVDLEPRNRPFPSVDDLAGVAPSAEYLHWEQRSRHLERQLPFRVFLEGEETTQEQLEELLQFGWLVDGVRSLQIALDGVTADVLLEAWRIEKGFWEDLRPWVEGAPARGASFDERQWYHRNVLSPEALAGMGRACRSLGDIGMPPELVERFRERVMEEYH